MISVAHDHNPARKLWMLVDRDLKDISDTDTIVRWRNSLRLFLCAQSPPARHGGNQEYCAEPNPKGLRFKHRQFFIKLMAMIHRRERKSLDFCRRAAYERNIAARSRTRNRRSSTSH